MQLDFSDDTTTRLTAAWRIVCAQEESEAVMM